MVSSFAIHHFPPDLRGVAVHEMHRVLRPGGQLLIADFQAPTGRVPAFLARALTGHAMARSDVAELDVLLADAGFAASENGGIGRWIRYTSAVRPASA